MMYLFEAKIPENKSVLFALTYIYGINKTKSLFICKKIGFSKNFKIKYLSKEHINKLVKIIESLNINLASDLKKIKLLNSKNLINIKSYRGLRKNQGLSVRGQRTHTNAKTSNKIR